MSQNFVLPSQLLKLLAGACIAAAAGSSSASLVVSSSIGGVPAGVSYVNFESIDLGALGGVSNGIAVSFSGTAQLVQGSIPERYAAPFLSNSNGTLFGDLSVSGPDSTKYVSTGHNGDVTLLLPEPERYLGLLWGSVDPQNTLTFYDAGGNSLGSVTGTDVTNNANGDRGEFGTYYVNITSTQSFSRVVASGNGQVFEFDNVAFNATYPVPEASSYAMLLAGLGVLGVVIRRRKNA